MTRSLAFLSVFFFCNFLSLSAQPDSLHPASYVDPVIGTGYGGETYPGAVAPWGIVSVSPHNASSSAGFHYGGGELFGFGHIHFSGVGCPGLGNIILMPTAGKITTTPDQYKSYLNCYYIERSPGYLKTAVRDYDVMAEMTATQRAGMSRYVFRAHQGDANILLDVSEGLMKSKAGYVRIVSDTEIEGWTSGDGFCGGLTDLAIYFYARFSKPAETSGTWSDTTVGTSREQSGADIGAFFRYTTGDNEAILVKVGISYSSMDNAKLNLDAEMPDWDFDGIHQRTFHDWDRELSKIEVYGGTSEQKVAFYTALYHMLLHPNVLNDVNGDYMPMGRGALQKTKGHTRYTVFSLWDTFRTVHPLLSLLYPDKQTDMLKTLVEQYQEKGWISKWECAGEDAYCMNGDPASAVFADASAKGMNGFDIATAYEGMRKSAMTTGTENVLRYGLNAHLKYGYIPMDDRGDNNALDPVSTSLEYCYNDWTVAQVARSLCREDDYEILMKRSEYYKNLYDAETGFLRPRNKDSSWYSPFNPDERSIVFTEGTAWQYLFYVAHDIPGLITLMGEQNFSRKLQTFCDSSYFIWNENNFAFPYLFTYLDGKIWKTQKAVRSLMKKYFVQGSGGVQGNEDCGAISSWYLFSAMGFYPACAGNDRYQIGSPLFDSVVIHLDERYFPGKRFVIAAHNNTPESWYIQSAQLNGKSIRRPFLTHKEITDGGRIDFAMTTDTVAFATIMPPPRLLYPVGISIYTRTQSPLYWHSVLGASSYQIQVASTQSFCSSLLDTIIQGDTTTIIRTLDSSLKKYYWHARAFTDDNESDWSVPQIFYTDDTTSLPIPPIFADHSTAFPNPFRQNVAIRFSVPSYSHVKLSITTILGQTVALLAHQEMDVGTYTMDWDASSAVDGLYLYTLHIGASSETHTLLLMR